MPSRDLSAPNLMFPANELPPREGAVSLWQQRDMSSGFCWSFHLMDHQVCLWGGGQGGHGWMGALSSCALLFHLTGLGIHMLPWAGAMSFPDVTSASSVSCMCMLSSRPFIQQTQIPDGIRPCKHQDKTQVPAYKVL